METIKINFADYGSSFDFKTDFIFKFLRKRYNLELSDNPDYLFCSCFGYKHWKYENCVRIYFTGENTVPDFNLYDYGISFYYLTLDDRHLRFPLWLQYSWDQLDQMEGGGNFRRAS